MLWTLMHERARESNPGRSPGGHHSRQRDEAESQQQQKKRSIVASTASASTRSIPAMQNSRPHSAPLDAIAGTPADHQELDDMPYKSTTAEYFMKLIRRQRSESI